MRNLLTTLSLLLGLSAQAAIVFPPTSTITTISNNVITVSNSVNTLSTNLNTVSNSVITLNTALTGGYLSNWATINTNALTLAVTADRMPAFTGAITTSVGSTATTLSALTQVNFTTNNNPLTPDFTLGYQQFSTNAAFTFLAPAGVDTTKLQCQTTTTFVTNSTAVAVLMTAPANVHTEGTWYVTNLTAITWVQYAQKWTNAIALPLW